MKNNIEKRQEKPTKPCWNCGSEFWWKRKVDGAWLCPVCHPPQSGEEKE